MYQKRALINASSSSATVKKLQQDPFYKYTYEKCAAQYKIQPNKPLPPGVDPQDNSEQATFTYDELVKIADALLRSPEPKDARDLSMLLWMCMTCGRGDDARPRRLCELTEPKLRSSIGERQLWVWHAACHTRGGGGECVCVWWVGGQRGGLLGAQGLYRGGRSHLGMRGPWGAKVCLCD